MLNNKRIEELENIKAYAIGAYFDRYYVDMEQDTFDKCMKNNELKQHFIMLRKGNFDEYLADMAKKIANITLAEELHYMILDYNFDDGFWFLEQIIMNPACDRITAKMLYWLSDPGYYYEKYGSPLKCPQDNINIDGALFLAKMESKANGEGFQTGLKLDAEPLYDQPKRLDYTIEPYCNVPEVFR